MKAFGERELQLFQSSRESFTSEFLNPETNEKILLKYKPTAETDILLTIDSGSDLGKRKYIFAPKYLAGANTAALSDGVNLMHRYINTPIGSSNPLGAYLLFPSNNSNDTDTSSVCAIPFLPGESETLTRFINAVISENEPKSILFPAEVEASLSGVNFDKLDVIIGSLGSVRQMEDNLEKLYYYVPECNFEAERLPIRAVALYQSEKMFGSEAGIRFWGYVTDCKRVQRKKIKFPMRHNNPDEWYYAFRIEKWNDLPSPILIKNETVYKPRYTNLFLLQNSVDTNELFNTHSSEEYRLMYELRQVISSADTYAVYR